MLRYISAMSFMLRMMIFDIYTVHTYVICYSQYSNYPHFYNQLRKRPMMTRRRTQRMELGRRMKVRQGSSSQHPRQEQGATKTSLDGSIIAFISSARSHCRKGVEDICIIMLPFSDFSVAPYTLHLFLQDIVS